MDRISRFFSITSFILVCAVIVFTFFSKSSSNKMGYVLLNDLRDSFLFSKEIDKKFEAIISQRNNLLDSIKYNVAVAEKQGLKEFEFYQNLYTNKAQEFENSNLKLREEYDAQIWQQINQYILEYGKKENYRYIFGASGSGNLMYVSESENLTKDVLKYINEKYKGK